MFDIKIEPGKAFDELEHLAAGIANATPLMRSIAAEFESQTEANFEAEGRPAWLGLKPSTIAQRERQGTWPGKILQRSAGGLAPSIESAYDADSSVIGSNKVYAAIQQLGGTINKGAQSRLVRHRTDAKGNLLRSEHLNGKGLIFAKDSHKRAVSRWFEQAAHSIDIPARPYLPVDAQGNMQPEAEEGIMSVTNDYLRTLCG